MYLIQILLPLYDNEGERQPSTLFADVRATLTDQFGGLTAYTRAPARGVWQADMGETSREDIVVYEVMADDLDRHWWAGFREQLERSFRQEQVVVRSHEITVL